MAKHLNTRLYLAKDQQYTFPILNGAETVAIDITGWALSFMIKRRKTDADAAALLTKTTGSGIAISGIFNSAPATNTQLVTVTIQDTDTLTITSGLAFFELARTDPGFETVLTDGSIELIKPVHSS